MPTVYCNHVLSIMNVLSSDNF
uniref:Uncharacterized protein n=1 Tax=Anguilla anguilla TaxID=7936 RepID=A0A0E9XPT5_ANGAN